jgi:hypothetical protein
MSPEYWAKRNELSAKLSRFLGLTCALASLGSIVLMIGLATTGIFESMALLAPAVGFGLLAADFYHDSLVDEDRAGWWRSAGWLEGCP